MPYKAAPVESLPPELGLPDATIQQVMTFRNESPRTVWRKIRNGTYESYKDGDRRLITWKSVLEDRERCRKLGPQLSQPPATGKRPRGRPKKTTESLLEGPSSETAQPTASPPAPPLPVPQDAPQARGDGR
jgi:hypothetical protein